MKATLTLLLSFLITASNWAADYYWIGGSGNWSDISHWATQSGGNLTHATFPSSDDNVFFDENSFTAPGQTVTLAADIVFCKTMDWSTVTNNPSFEGAENVAINIFGDLILSESMEFDFKGGFNFTGVEEDKVVDLAGQFVGGVVTFNGDSNWQLLRPLNVDSMLHIISGNLDLNDQDVTCKFFYANTTNPKRVDLSNSNITISGSTLPSYPNANGSRSMLLNLTNLELIPGNSRIEFTAENATLFHLGNGEAALNEVVFSEPSGQVNFTSTYFNNRLHFNELSIFASARIQSLISADLLTLTGGNLYQFQSGRTYEFGNLLANGNCAQGVIVTSERNGLNATFQVDAGNIDLSYFTLRDIHAEGGATFMANSSVDLGNNDGWNFTNDTSIDYYWIGGTGDWTDAMHWSFTSGGPPSGCVPSGKDNVFFDANSFNGANQTVSINERNIYIHNVTWNGVTNNPDLIGPDAHTLNITGSLELAANMQHSFEGNYDFESNETGNTIRTNGQIFNQEIRFSGLDGDWTFLDDLEVQRYLTLISGHLVTNGVNVVAMRLWAGTTLPRLLDIRGSYIRLRYIPWQNPVWQVELENFEILADNSTIEFDADGGDFVNRGNNPGPMPQYNNVIFSTNDGNVESINYSTPEDTPAIGINHLTFRGRGDLQGSSHFGILELSSGYNYGFDSEAERTQYIDELITIGACETGLTQFNSFVPSARANIQINQDYNAERLYIRDINMMGNNFVANNSVDGGNNSNITFIEFTGRTLYWVGDGGMWQDPAHWSLTSGGPGGECIPTAIDNVIFDELSFTLDNQVVNTPPSQFAMCHDITWTNTFGIPRFENGVMIVSGSILYDQSFNNNVYFHILTGRDAELIESNGQRFDRILVRGEGSFEFTDDLEVTYLLQRAGSMRFNDINASLGTIEFQEQTPKTFDLGNSIVTINDNGNNPFNDNSRTLNVLPGASELIFTGVNSGIFSRSNIELNNVDFPNVTGRANLLSRLSWDEGDTSAKITANRIRMNGNGEVIGSIETDTLIGSAGKIYTFESSRDIIVHSFLQMIGNNCTPIEIRSSTNSGKANVVMPASAEMIVDFVQMKNLIGLGGATFNAGSRSVDVASSNEGWIFEDAQDFIETGFLGQDRGMCTGSGVELSAFSFSLNEMYLWNDGSTDSILFVSEPGVYSVEVQFETNCSIVDSVMIFSPDEVLPDLPDEVSICNDLEVTLDPGIELEQAEFLWSDGSGDSTLNVQAEGIYSLIVDVAGCLSFDTVQVYKVENPGLDLGINKTHCEGEDFELSSNVGADAFEWSNGFQDSVYMGNEGGDYWLEIEINGCPFRDSISVTTLVRPLIEIGEDTSICASEALPLEVISEVDAPIEWQDGTTGNTFIAETEGWYKATIDPNGCSNSDSLYLSVIPNPEIELGEDVTACEGEEVFLQIDNISLNILWDDGSDDLDRSVTEDGIYSVTVEENGCKSRDSVKVQFQALPRINLGNDTIVCEDIPLILSPKSLSGGNISWEDGSTSNAYLVEDPGVVHVFITNGNCSSQDSIMVAFERCTYFDVFAPNIFSPNQDGFNDFFQINVSGDIVIESFEMSIYDRWGNQVFVSRSIDEVWDGRIQNGDLLQGVYSYFAKIDYIDDRGPGSELLKGDVSIFK